MLRDSPQNIVNMVQLHLHELQWELEVNLVHHCLIEPDKVMKNSCGVDSQACGANAFDATQLIIFPFPIAYQLGENIQKVEINCLTCILQWD